MATEQNLTILAVDDDTDGLFALAKLLASNGFKVETATTGEEAISKAKECLPAAILLDVMMPRLNGHEVIKRLKADSLVKYIPVIFLTGKVELEDITRGLDEGADDYITKPYRAEEVLSRVNAVLRLKRLYQELKSAEDVKNRFVTDAQSKYSLSVLVCESKPMKAVIEALETIANADSPVLIQGQSGTGKELVAKALHYNSNRKSQPFLIKNCAAFPDNLIDSELFGYVKGAFTGANDDRK